MVGDMLSGVPQPKDRVTRMGEAAFEAIREIHCQIIGVECNVCLGHSSLPLSQIMQKIVYDGR